MNLGNIVEKLSKVREATTEFVRKEKDYLTAARLASYAVILDATTTSRGLSHNPDTYEGVKQIFWNTWDLMNRFGIDKGLAIESSLTLGLALPLSYTLNKVIRGEWDVNKLIKNKGFLSKSIRKEWPLKKILKNDWGPVSLYFLSAASIGASINNLYWYYAGYF